MKTTGFRSFVLYILLFAFCGGFVWFLINLALNGSTWATQPYNGHIYGDDTAVSAGTITDRSGMVLAKTEDGSRVYAESEDIRRALLHTVGDSSGYIGTAVQAVHRSQLVGYNPITGLARTVLSDLGNNLVLTVDANASAAAYNAFNGRNGSAFVYNYKTGEVLVKVSAPTYDPMNVPEDLNDNEEYNGVFLDHTLSSTYTPGSIFKLVTAAAAMEYLPDWDTRTYTCEEEMDIGSGKVTCLNYHGELNLEQALGYSCNLYFAQLAEDIGAENLKKKAEEMGFGKNFSFDFVTTDKSSTNLSSSTSAIDLAWSSVGQADVMANPYHMALLMGAIANGGSTPEPYLTGGKSRLIDAGMAGDGFFINVAGFGFDVDVVRYTEKYKRRLNGMLPYMLGILQSLIYLSRTEAEIVTDSGETFNVTVTLLSACNGTRFAGGINLAPLADYSDGLMDICILKKISWLRF